MQAAQEAEEGQRPQNGVATGKDMAKAGLCKAAEAEGKGSYHSCPTRIMADKVNSPSLFTGF